MRTTNILFILTILTLFSCKSKKEQQLEKDIVGEWIYIRTQDIRKPNTNDELLPPPPPFGRNTSGYIFNDDKSCENKLGYFKRIEGKRREERKTIYLGNKTQYKIEEDSLKIYNLLDSSWQSQKIFSIIEDTLTIQTSDSLFEKYARIKYKLNRNETYDKIIVSSSGCFGACPILDISIDKNGNVIYFGERFNTQNGLFTSKISKEEYQNIETTFKKAEINNLKDSYQANWTDDEAVTITFVKNDKIIKSITDYGRQAPTELIWAYTPVRFLYQQINLKPLKPEITNFPKWSISFETAQKICNLTKSESFYLLTEIIKGKEVAQKFDSKYKIEFWNDNDKKEIIFTDGRIFKFTNKTIDIGYNFLTENNLTTKFRNKNEYER